MVSAINSSPSLGPAGSGPSVASLQAQLDRCQKQLSDNVNCASANTREGKETIQALSNKISEIKARIQEAGKADKPPTLESGRSAAIGAKVQHGTTAAVSAASGFAFTALGTRLDVFA